MIRYAVSMQCPHCGHPSLHAALLAHEPPVTLFSCSRYECAAQWQENGDHRNGPVTPGTP